MLDKQPARSLTLGECFANFAVVIALLFFLWEIFNAEVEVYKKENHSQLQLQSPETNITQEKHYGAASRRSE